MTTLYWVQLTSFNETYWACHEAYHDAATGPVGFFIGWYEESFVEQAKIG